MRVFREGNRVRLQLMDMQSNKMLFNFSVEEEAFPELKKHMIKAMEEFEQ